ncbi:hypothetical protein D3C72_1228840 [compost metagenome]
MRTALARGAVPGGGRFDEVLAGRRHAHLVQDAVVGGDDELGRVQLLCGLDQLRGRADHIGLRHHVFRRFRVHQDLGVGEFAAQQVQLDALELVVHQARALPQQHVGAGLLLDIAAQVLVGCPQDLLALRMQVLDDLQADAGGHHPVRARLHGGAGVGVDHHGAVRVRIAEGGELIGRATQVERAGRVQVRHQHGLLGAQDLGGLAHEAHAGHDQRLGGMIAAEARHFQRIRHAAAGFLG